MTKQAEFDTARQEVDKVKAEAARLAQAANQPGATPEQVASDGRKLALISRKIAGTWGAAAAEAERWRRSWREGGAEALRSAGPASLPKLSAAQFVELEAELGKGPAAHGFEDQRWTLVRVQAVIGRRFRMRLSIATVWRLLKRHGWSWQAPARRALERDERAVELWKQEVWPRVKAPRRRSEPGSSSRTRPGSR
ncbi:winged helix-turn-helix domain-containing protein [Kitasatospora purpeofusca]|uniref:helix-turn-helix domain-containing protein n=1 Tax=Kitasatospora purpeofusca TaxID=67352 RepID=UPI003816018C